MKKAPPRPVMKTSARSETKLSARKKQLAVKEKVEKKKVKREGRRQRQKEREELGDKAPPKQEPRTIENTREHDETTVVAQDENVTQEENVDEFSGVFAGRVTPKIMLTTSYKATRISFAFLREFMRVVPNVVYYRRGQFEMKKILQFALNNGFTDVVVVREDHKELTGLVHSHLPDGPTADYRLTSFIPSERVQGHGRKTPHTPEVILNNFTTRLGHRVGRMLGAIFPHNPEFRGRQVVTVHNQRDFIFVRFHRYIFSDEGKKVRLQELGPRFTLKLRSLQRGGFQPSGGEYEWVQKKELNTSKRRFFL